MFIAIIKLSPFLFTDRAVPINDLCKNIYFVLFTDRLLVTLCLMTPG